MRGSTRMHAHTVRGTAIRTRLAPAGSRADARAPGVAAIRSPCSEPLLLDDEQPVDGVVLA